MKNLTLFLLLVPGFLLAQPAVDYFKILKNGADYNNHDSRKFPSFFYQSATDSSLVALRKKYTLDSVAGYSNEESRVLNLMHWVHNIINHSSIPDPAIKSLNADAIITLTQEKRTGVTCKEIATVLNECYLAMGWKSRKVYCYPKDSANTDVDFHVINMVYLNTQKKWIMTDPTNDAYIMNRDGELLGIEEFRKFLISNRSVILNPEANLNRIASVMEKEYLNYMAKNLYLFYCPLTSAYDYETKAGNKALTYVYLVPLDYDKTSTFKSEEIDYSTGTTKTIYYTNNANMFWQDPVLSEKNNRSK